MLAKWLHKKLRKTGEKTLALDWWECVPVATDVWLVTHSSQGDPVELPAQGAGNGAAHAGFSHTWRPHEA